MIKGNSKWRALPEEARVGILTALFWFFCWVPWVDEIIDLQDWFWKRVGVETGVGATGIVFGIVGPWIGVGCWILWKEFCREDEVKDEAL